MQYLRKQGFWLRSLYTVALLCLAVVLTACPAGGGNNNGDDTTPPTIGTLELQDPADSTVSVAKIISLQVVANDETGLAKVEFFQDGQKIGEDASAPYEQSINLTKENNGSLSFTAKAIDNAENESALSNAVSVAVAIKTATLVRESKSSAIAITGNDKLVVQVNPENDSVTTFDATTSAKLKEVKVGDEPVAVVIHPDDDTAFVVVRADHKIVKITGLGSNPVKADEVVVGSEPTGLALSPTGKKLVVTEFGQSRISLIDTETMNVVDTFDMPNPRGVAISNDNDEDDNDEKVVVTEFYGRLIADENEAKDNTRTGAVRIFDLNDNNLAAASTAEFPPLDDIGNFQPGPNISNIVTKVTSPNQLYSVAIAGDKFFVVATAASPDGNASFNQNIRQLVLVGQVSTGKKLGVINLSAEIKNEVPDDKQNFMADIVDLSLIGEDILYFASRGGDGFQRALLNSDSDVTLGVSFKDAQGNTVKAPQVDLLAEQKCLNPIGIVTAHDNSDTKRAFVNCWVSRTMVTVDLKLQPQKAIASTPSANAPAAGLEAEQNLGRRFYFTGRARWSNEAWSSCGSCHPDGLADNITWRFGAGPRQTISMDSTFYGPNRDIQHVLNWSGEREEIHDFERNTRGVSGGLGAITEAITPGGVCKTDPLAANEKRLSLNPADATDPNGLKVQLGLPVKEIQDTTAGVCVKDWDDITEFVRTIRPVTSTNVLGDNDAAVARGRTLFEQGGCQTCHSGEGWTVSSTDVFLDPAKNNEPSSTRNTTLAGTDFDGGKLIEPERTPDVTTNPIVPAQLRCVLRNVGTFGVNNDTAATDVLELKPPDKDNKQGRAQGEFSGFNIPSLFGLAASAPYLHHGQANTLQDLLTSPAYNDHLVAGGNNTFTTEMDDPGKVTDLTNFLLAIDEDTQIFPIPAGADLCAQFK
jgi:cytochrome c peroxidase